MKQRAWQEWLENNQEHFGEGARAFLQEAQLMDVQPNKVVFQVGKESISIKKNSTFSWLMPSSVFVPYGSLSEVLSGLNVLLKENHMNQ